jgi:enamine deaminase RidA (YjgF/YER057c/UK114 family)
MEIETGKIESTQFIESLAYLLLETFEGSPAGEGSAYLDQGVGFFSTLAVASAEKASQDFYGTTIAAQAEHAKFYLDRLCEFINGRTTKVNWDDSWLIETVNDEEWDALRSAVEKSYKDTLRCIAEPREWTTDQIGMSIGLVTHTAYHLGAIRQIAKAV